MTNPRFLPSGVGRRTSYITIDPHFNVRHTPLSSLKNEEIPQTAAEAIIRILEPSLLLNGVWGDNMPKVIDFRCLLHRSVRNPLEFFVKMGRV